MFGREQRMLLRHYLEQRLSKAAIARLIGVSRRTVYHWIASGQLDRELDDVAVRYQEPGHPETPGKMTPARSGEIVSSELFAACQHEEKPTPPGARGAVKGRRACSVCERTEKPGHPETSGKMTPARSGEIVPSELLAAHQHEEKRTPPGARGAVKGCRACSACEQTRDAQAAQPALADGGGLVE